MNIQEEYERLQKLAQTKEGWVQIEEAWNLAIGMEKTQESAGSLVEGFAIDTKTKRTFCGETSDHSRAYFELYDYLLENEEGVDCDEIEYRLIKGWRGKILDFQMPCIYMASVRFFYEPGLLRELEKSILEQGIGLPLSGLFLARIR